jgi:hypothetical protein
MKITLYAVPASGAGFLSIVATQSDRYVEIVEDGSGVAAGLKAKLPYDKFVQTFQYAAGVPIVLGNHLTQGKGRSEMRFRPIQVDQGGTVTLSPADILVKITSAGAATVVRVVEND